MAFAGRFCPIAVVSYLGRNWGPVVSGLQRPFTAGERIDPETRTAASYCQYRGAGLWCWFLSVLGWTLASDAKGHFIRSCRLVDLWRVHLVERHLAYGRSHARTVWYRNYKFACTDLVANRTRVLRDTSTAHFITVFVSLSTCLYLWLNFTGFDPAHAKGLTQRIFSSINALWPAVIATMLLRQTSDLRHDT